MKDQITAVFFTAYLIYVSMVFLHPTAVHAQVPSGYDIMIIAGQSNSWAGIGRDDAIDVGANNILELGRYGANEHQIIPATEPLSNFDYTNYPNYTGYGLALARQMQSIGFGTSERPLVIVPAAKGSTGFATNFWNPGNPGEVDLIERVNYVMKKPGTNRIIGMFWIQGEDDVVYHKTQVQYQNAWLAMVHDYESKIVGFSANTPIFVGQMVPSWVRSQGTYGAAINAAHKNLPTLRSHTYFVSAEQPVELGQNDEAYLGIADIPIHYSAQSQREFAKRFFSSYSSNSGVSPMAPFNPALYNGQVIKGSSPTAYLIENGTRRQIPDWDTFLSLHIPGNQMTELPDATMELFPVGTALTSVHAPAPPIVPGDLTGDGHVDLADYNKLVGNFGNPYTLADYNKLVSNFGI